MHKTTKNPATTCTKLGEIDKLIHAPDVRDEENPQYLFSTTSTALLLAIANGLIDATNAARWQLAARGFDGNGDWCGFEQAAAIHFPHTKPVAAPVDVARVIGDIASEHLCIATLTPQGRDQHDFHDVSCWGLEAALRAAFEAGRKAGQ